jgi:hypothetical protein
MSRVVQALAVLAVLLLTDGTAAQSPQSSPGARLVVLPPIQNAPGGAAGAVGVPQVKPPTGKQDLSPPLYGQPQPQVGADPAPGAKSGGRCPNGYAEAGTQRVAHLVVCVVVQPNAVPAASGVPVGGQSFPAAPYPGIRPAPPAGTPLRPNLGTAAVNQCVGVPGYYACGRGGTECCAPKQDNRCFPGAFACAAPGAPVGAAKQACCISR